jgi:hypothetical protein
VIKILTNTSELKKKRFVNFDVKWVPENFLRSSLRKGTFTTQIKPEKDTVNGFFQRMIVKCNLHGQTESCVAFKSAIWGDHVDGRGLEWKLSRKD